VICAFENCRKVEPLSTLLPDVIGSGTWTFDDSNRGDPGGSGLDDGFDTGVGVYELQPVTDPVSPSDKYTDPTYLEVTESAPEQTVIAPDLPSPRTHSRPLQTSILVDPSSLERRNHNGQVCVCHAVYPHHRSTPSSPYLSPSSSYLQWRFWWWG